MNKKIVGLVIAFSILVTGLMGCESTAETSTDLKKTKQQESSFFDMYSKVGRPKITRWTEAKQLKDIYEARDDADLICYAYTKNEMTGKYVYEGRCRGFGIPYSTQFSNPEKVVDMEKEYGHNWSSVYGLLDKIPQPEPNGLFMPTSSSATWLMMIDEDGNEEIQYFEPSIVVTQSKKRVEVVEKYSIEGIKY
jgi:hypothetical protein